MTSFLAIVGLFSLLALGCWLFAACIKLHTWLWKLRNDLDDLEDRHTWHFDNYHCGGKHGQ